MNRNFIAALSDAGDESDFLRQIKFQLLTREQIVIAGSALLSKPGLALLQREPTLVSAIRSKAIQPAIRSSFSSVGEFVLSLHETTLTDYEKESLCEHVPSRLSWNLRDATTQFEDLFTAGILNDDPMHQGFAFPMELANEIVATARDKSAAMGSDWIRPDAAKVSGRLLAPEHEQAISDFVDLLYRICGAHAVNAAPILPALQYETYVHTLSPELSRKLTSSDVEAALFWDAFMSAVHDFECEAVGFTVAQLDALSLRSILSIREKFEMRDFWRQYWNVVQRAMVCVDFNEAVSIIDVASQAKIEFAAAIRAESKLDTSEAREHLLGESAVTLVKVAADTLSLGLLPAALAGGKLLVKTVEWKSPKTATKMENVRKRTRALMNGSTQSRKPLLEGYDAITCRPLSKRVKPVP